MPSMTSVRSLHIPCWREPLHAIRTASDTEVLGQISETSLSPRARPCGQKTRALTQAESQTVSLAHAPPRCIALRVHAHFDWRCATGTAALPRASAVKGILSKSRLKHSPATDGDPYLAHAGCPLESLTTSPEINASRSALKAGGFLPVPVSRNAAAELE